MPCYTPISLPHRLWRKVLLPSFEDPLRLKILRSDSDSRDWSLEDLLIGFRYLSALQFKVRRVHMHGACLAQARSGTV